MQPPQTACSPRTACRDSPPETALGGGCCVSGTPRCSGGPRSSPSGPVSAGSHSLMSGKWKQKGDMFTCLHVYRQKNKRWIKTRTYAMHWPSRFSMTSMLFKARFKYSSFFSRPTFSKRTKTQSSCRGSWWPFENKSICVNVFLGKMMWQHI